MSALEIQKLFLETAKFCLKIAEKEYTQLNPEDQIKYKPQLEEMRKEVARVEEALLKHLCDSCEKSDTFPTCLPDDVEFGLANGLDNVIKCSNFQPYGGVNVR